MSKKINFFTLDNGLKVIIYSDKNCVKYTAEIDTFFGGLDKFYYGDNNRKNIYPGTAHFLEHYVFENSKYGDMNRIFYENEVLDCNAITNNRQTIYFFKTIHNFEENLKLLIDSVYNPIFSKERIEDTKYPIVNEIRESTDKLSKRNYYKKMRFVFNDYKAVVGNISSVSKITSKYLEEVYRYFYVPKNQILVIAGNLDVEKMLDYVKEIYSNYNFVNNEKRSEYIDNSKVKKSEGTIKGGNLDIIDVLYKVDVSNMSSFDKYKNDWYINMFLKGTFSRFFKVNEYLNSNNIITGDISYSSYYEMGVLFIDIAAYTEKKKVFVDIVDKAINNIYEFDERDFELLKKEDRLRVAVRDDYPSNMIGPTIDNYVTFDYFGEDTMDFVDSLNYDECISYLSKIDFSNRCIVVTKKD